VVLALIGAALILGGIRLLTLGGSAYYLLAGLAVAGSAYFVSRGDRRGVVLYAAMLALTAFWALWESGFNGWGLQARLMAPAVLGLWVCAPWLKKLGARVLAPAAAVAILAIGFWLYGVNRPHSVSYTESSAGTSGPIEWTHYGNDLGGSRYSPADQINPGNVSKLEHAWTYETGVKIGLGFEATPLMVGDTLYVCTQNNIIIALDPETGQRRWQYDPKVDAPPGTVCRGVAYYKVADASGPCAERIIFATTDARMMAVDNRSGAVCAGFGNAGTIDLKKNMGQVRRGYYYVSSAPTIVNGIVVIGGWVMDNQEVGEPSGVIRGFSAIDGKFAWAWDMDRPDFHGEPPADETYSRGTPNSWAPMSGDEALGLVYVPTGNSTPDYWGAHRSPNSEKYSSSIVALDSRTGQVRWHFQTVHHDLWDYDVPAQPTLIDLPIKGQTVPALIQATKQGQIYVLDRRNGQPLTEVVEKPVPQGPSQGDFLSPTQPFSVGMPSFDNTVLSEKLMWGATPLDQLWCRIRFKGARYDGPYTPPGIKPNVFYPGTLGGVDWGGVSVDPQRRLLVVNWNRVPIYMQLVPRAEAGGIQPTETGMIHMGDPSAQAGTPFAALNGPFLSPLNMPCTQPPFGMIGVVDLDSRKLIWQKPLGTSADSGPLGLRSILPLPMGVPNTGGTLSTRTGLIFIGATQERRIRAYDSRSGKLLWSAPLPTGGHATPMTYISPKSGRQFIVIAAGGNASLQTPAGDHVVAFALPKAR
jgi:membrane-bound PQQ-dependent dehydrogenase (glucose/quinate/shikimate family)